MIRLLKSVKKSNKVWTDLSLNGATILFPGENVNIGLVWVMVFNATFNNISVISWQSVLLVEETGKYITIIPKYNKYLM
jgi:hypothetical protein